MCLVWEDDIADRLISSTERDAACAADVLMYAIVRLVVRLAAVVGAVVDGAICMCYVVADANL